MGDQAPELEQAQGHHEDVWVAGVTARAPSNIAVIKYWGKRDERLILPLNSSLSATLDCRDLAAQTTVTASPAFDRDRLWLNGKEVSLDTHRYQACLSALRARATSVTTTAWPLAYLRQLRQQQQPPERPTDGGDGCGGDNNRNGRSSNAGFEVTVTGEQWRRPVHVHIVSHNNFPTAAGLASSAAGFACLVFSVARLMGVKESFPGELTTLARLGSGSACRSLYGGFVRWNRGEREDGSDSTAEQVALQNHWPDLAIIVAVVNDEKKDVSSTGGMKRSVETSQLLHFRAKEVVPQRMHEMEKAIAARDFNTFARLTCADSNQFHATCLDTQPPIFYLNQTSRQIIELVEKWNAEDGVARAAYTFDAGPNAVLFVEGEANAKELMTRLLSRFPPPLPPTSTDGGRAAADEQELQHRLRSLIVGSSDVTSKLREVAASFVKQGADEATRGDDLTSAIRYFICTSVGEGPHLVSEVDRDAHQATLAGVCQLSSS